jgi:hypothetical protein
MGAAPSSRAGPSPAPGWAPQPFVFTPPKCPDPFTSVDAFSCIMPCPTDRQFTRQGDKSGYKCVYTPDPRYSVSLSTVGAAIFQGSTIADLQTADAKRAAEFSIEQTRFTGELEVLYANIDRETKIKNAFQSLQAAENARGEAPMAYQQARTNYYTLIQGDRWKSTEVDRIAKQEVEPEIRQFRKNLADVQVRQQQQQKTIDVVNGLRDRVLTLKDDFKYSTDTLQRQLGKIKDQIIYDRRKRQEQSTDTTWDLLDKGLNYAIIGVLLLAVWKIYSTYFAGPSKEGSSSSSSSKPAVSTT